MEILAFVWIVAGVLVCVGVFIAGFVSGVAWFRSQTAADVERLRAATFAAERNRAWHSQN